MSALALPPGRPRGEWHGFPCRSLHVPPRGRLELVADYGGPDDFPLPLAVLIQRDVQWLRDRGFRSTQYIELTADELRWLVEQAPAILERMEARP